jgi:hypothetical protein
MGSLCHQILAATGSDDIRAGFGKPAHNGATNATGSAHDECHFVCQFQFGVRHKMILKRDQEEFQKCLAFMKISTGTLMDEAEP